jgi:hypothetical protein
MAEKQENLNAAKAPKKKKIVLSSFYQQRENLTTHGVDEIV